MDYIAFAYLEGEEDVMVTGPVSDGAATYLQDVVKPLLQPLSDDEYTGGPMAILRTPARHGYVLDGDSVYLCIEWKPGLVVVRFEPDAPMAWAALASPHPKDDTDADDWPDETPDPQYDLVYDAWDAQFEVPERDDWDVVDAERQARFEAATQHASTLASELRDTTDGDDDAEQRWMESCQSSPIWKGDVVMG